MNKNGLITPILIVLLSLLFLTICLMVFLSGGKSKQWIAHKMKIGGILLSFSAISSGTGCITTCYDPEPSPYMIIDAAYNDSIVLNLDTGNVIKGTVYTPDSRVYSFAIIGEDGQKKQNDTMIPLDGEFDSYQEPFKLEIINTLEPGDYLLKIYNCDAYNQNIKNNFQNYNLRIKND
jgi:hypothetical protein